MDFSSFVNTKVKHKLFTLKNPSKPFLLSSGDPVDWEPVRLQWELENSIINWNYEEFISEYNLALVTSNWHITQHFDPRE